MARENQNDVLNVRGSVKKMETASVDTDLMRRIASGDRQAFDEFYARNSPWLIARLRRRCRNNDVVLDVIQDTFVSVWRSGSSYTGKGDPGAWLWGIASRRLIDAFRKMSRELRVTALVENADGSPSAEEVVMENVLDARMASALAGLSPQLLAVLHATIIDGFSTRETAVLLGIPENTVKSRAYRGRAAMKEALA